MRDDGTASADTNRPQLHPVVGGPGVEEEGQEHEGGEEDQQRVLDWMRSALVIGGCVYLSQNV